MSTYDYDDGPRRHRSHHHHHDRRDDRDDREPRYIETQETYVRSGPKSAPPIEAPQPPYASTRTEIIRRPAREDSDLSIEEVRRDFPPPGAYDDRSLSRRDRYGPPARARSAERSEYAYYGGDSRRSYNDFDDHHSRKSSTYLETEVPSRHRSLSRNQKIIAAVGGAALAVGGKELWDRKKADGRPVSRNALTTAAVGAAGAFAGYEATEVYSKIQEKKEGKEKKQTYIAHRGRDGEVAEYYEEEEGPKKSRRKSIIEGAMGLAGLGAAAKAVGGGDKSRDRSPDSHKSGRSRSHHGGRDRSPEGPAKFQQAAKAALLAGATEAFRVRKEPGGWGGAKGKRILTAAIGAGGIDAAADRDPEHKSKRHILEAVVGGLAGNRLINGSRSNVAEDDRRSRSRSRARARSKSRGGDGGGLGSGAGLAALATAGIGALAGKKIYDRSQSKDPHGRRGSPDSYDSRSPSPRRDKHKRSKSVSDRARTALASFGIGSAAADDDRRRGDTREIEETVVHTRRRRSPRGYSSDEDDRPRHSKGRGDVYGDPRYADSRSSYGDARSKDGRRNRRIAEGKQSDSSSDLGSSTDDEKKVKKAKASRHHRDR